MIFDWMPPSVSNLNVTGEMPRLDVELASEDPESLDGQVSRLLNAVTDDLAVVNCLRGDEPVSEDAGRLLSIRYRWLVETLRHLNSPLPTPSQRKRTTFAFLLAMAVWEPRAQISQHLFSEVQASNEFLAEVAVLVASFGFQISIPPDAPLNQKELFERMTAADRAEDWQGLIDIAERFPLPAPEEWICQAVRYLYQMAPYRLADALARSPDWIHAAMKLSALKQADVFSIAARAGSARVCFAAMILVRAENELADASCRTSLETMLGVLSLDLGAWKSVLVAFNRYPLRYPWLQEPLGVALSGVSLEAIETYVESVPVSSSLDCAAQVERCLSRFKESASLQARLILWQRAYEKWESWGFQEPGDSALTKTVASTFDYAVLGWLKEGCTDAYLTSEIEAMEQEASNLEHEWYESITAFNGKLNTLLSRYRVFAHAVTSPPAAWTTEIVAKIPRVLGSNYALARYRI